jgi:arylsulfatase A-like enzyme
MKKTRKLFFQNIILIFFFFLLIGVCLGITDGLIEAIRNKYIEYRLTELFFWTLASNFNHHLGIFLIVAAGNVLFFSVLSLVGISPSRSTVFVLFPLTVFSMYYFYSPPWLYKILVKPGKLIKNFDAMTFFIVFSLLALIILIFIFGLRKNIRVWWKEKISRLLTNSCMLLTICLFPVLINILNHIDWSDSPTSTWNVILISIDTLRADRLGCYDYDKEISPNIDSFASEGIQFTKAISQSAWTLPAHASLFTGLYPSVHGAYNSRRNLSSSYLTLAEILYNSGYSTAAFTGAGYLNPKYGFKQGFENYKRFHTLDSEDIWQYIENRNGEPFFLFLHTYTVHDYYVPDELMERINDEFCKNFNDWQSIKQFLSKYCIEDLGDESSDTLDCLKNRYDLSILYIDQQFGSLMNGLADRELLEKTLVILLSDHGEEFGEHSRTGHGKTLYNEQIHIPLLIRVPGRIPENQVIYDIIELIDVFPTILEYLGIPVPKSIDGHSLVSLIEGGKEPFDRFAFSEISNEEDEKYAICGTSMKLIYSPKAENSLSSDGEDLETFKVTWGSGWIEDPVDTTDKELLDTFNKWYTRMVNQKETSLSRDEISIDPALREELKALGYIQ